MAIKIVTDSTSYIPKEYVDKYDIKVVSLNVIMDEISRGEVDIANKYFYEEMNKVSEIPKSSQTIPEEMLNTLKAIDEIVETILNKI